MYVLSIDNNIDSNWIWINGDVLRVPIVYTMYVPRDWLNDWIWKERDRRFTLAFVNEKCPFKPEKSFYLQVTCRRFYFTSFIFPAECNALFGIFLKAQHVFISLSTSDRKYKARVIFPAPSALQFSIDLFIYVQDK